MSDKRIYDGDVILALSMDGPTLGKAERTGPVAFLWRSSASANADLLLITDQGARWVRGDDEEAKMALVATWKLMESAG